MKEETYESNTMFTGFSGREEIWYDSRSPHELEIWGIRTRAEVLYNFASRIKQSKM